jgi:hypothetical protein
MIIQRALRHGDHHPQPLRSIQDQVRLVHMAKFRRPPHPIARVNLAMWDIHKTIQWAVEATTGLIAVQGQNL